MSRLNLQTKLLLGAFLLLVFMMVVSTAVAGFVINRQNRTASDDRLDNAFNIIREDLSTRMEKALGDARQISSVNDMASKLKFLIEFKETDGEKTGRKIFRKVASSMLPIVQLSGILRASIYDNEGDLFAFAHRVADKEYTGGYFYQVPRPTFQIFDDGSWKKTETISDLVISTKSEIDPPEKETIQIREIDGFLCLVSRVPIASKIFNKESQKLEEKRIGFTETVFRMDDKVIKRLARLTGIEINAFAGERLSTGTLPHYNTFATSKIPSRKNQFSELLEKQIIKNDLELESDRYFQGIMPVYDALTPVGAFVGLVSMEVAKANTLQIIKLLGLVALACILLALPIFFLFSKTIMRPIKGVKVAMNKSSGDILTASHQIADASQLSAEGASEQAASIEETSSSLEEMASMTKQNSDTSHQAAKMIEGTQEIVKDANQCMKDLREAMDRINAASDQIARIVQDIDAVAFQTNLLALNAAVEAARAGEAGAGFAVVADEVRNLARRASEAASNTQEVIQNSLVDIREGSQLVVRTDEAFERVEQSTIEFRKLVEQIASASEEQAEGIDQLNRAVAQMDKVVQQNSAQAEESASSATELTHIAGTLETVTRDLALLVEGNRANKANHEEKQAVAAP